MIAHPDDESFGLGALLSGLTSEGRELRVLCFTHGEASTIGATERLGDIRRRELLEAAQVLGVAHVTLLDLPDGGLDALPDAELDQHIDDWLSPDTVSLLVLEPQGVTGHPDHRAATRVADRRGLAVIEWGIDPLTASRLAAEHVLRFEAIGDGPGVLDLRVDRTVELVAISRHGSQLDDDPVVCKRLAMHGDVERVRLRQPQRTPERAE